MYYVICKSYFLMCMLTVKSSINDVVRTKIQDQCILGTIIWTFVPSAWITAYDFKVQNKFAQYKNHSVSSWPSVIQARVQTLCKEYDNGFLNLNNMIAWAVQFSSHYSVISCQTISRHDIPSCWHIFQKDHHWISWFLRRC